MVSNTLNYIIDGTTYTIKSNSKYGNEFLPLIYARYIEALQLGVTEFKFINKDGNRIGILPMSVLRNALTNNELIFYNNRATSKSKFIKEHDSKCNLDNKIYPGYGKYLITQ